MSTLPVRPDGGGGVSPLPVRFASFSFVGGTGVSPLRMRFASFSASTGGAGVSPLRSGCAFDIGAFCLGEFKVGLEPIRV